jgi:glycosyltransferase involved in cell wall biosynthesis
MPRYSVIIPTYGRPAYLLDALESVFRQTVSDFEVIVVDDRSPVPVSIPDDSRVSLIRASVNGGPSAARNLGVAAASGRVITFLDDDDTWGPRRLEFAEIALQRAPIAVCWQSPKGGRILEGDVHEEILQATTPNFGATAVEMEAWVPLDESYRACEDVVWWIDVTRLHRVATTREHGLFVRHHGGDREGYGVKERIAASHRLMREWPGYFAANPQAAAFRWKRIGIMHEQLGNRSEAKNAFKNAVLLSRRPADALHLLHSYVAR